MAVTAWAKNGWLGRWGRPYNRMARRDEITGFVPHNDFESGLKPLRMHAQAGDEAAYREALSRIAPRPRRYFARRLFALPDGACASQALGRSDEERNMKMDESIAVLATHAGPAPRAAVARRLVPATAFGVLASVALALLILGPVDNLALPGAGFWIKLGYAAALGAAAAWLTGLLSPPGARSTGAALAVAGVVIAVPRRDCSPCSPPRWRTCELCARPIVGRLPLGGVRSVGLRGPLRASESVSGE